MRTVFAFNPTITDFDLVNAYWLGSAAKLAYSSEEEIYQRASDWGMDRCEFIRSTVEPPFHLADTQAFVMANRHIVITAFRGTEPRVLWDWLTDAAIRPVAGPNDLGKVHRGFSLALAAVYDEVKRVILQLQDNGQTLWYTGHSLGAALAVLMARRFQLETDRFPAGVYTFGQPRTGNEEFVSAFDSQLKAVLFRFVNNNDIVTRLPPEGLGYRDVWLLRYFNAEGVLEDDPTRWQRRQDRLAGRIDEIGQPGMDGFDDHSIGHYLKNLERLLSG